MNFGIYETVNISIFSHFFLIKHQRYACGALRKHFMHSHNTYCPFLVQDLPRDRTGRALAFCRRHPIPRSRGTRRTVARLCWYIKCRVTLYLFYFIHFCLYFRMELQIVEVLRFYDGIKKGTLFYTSRKKLHI